MNDVTRDPLPGDEPTTRLPLDDQTDETDETRRFTTLEDDLREHEQPTAAYDTATYDPTDDDERTRRAHVGYLLSALFFLGVAAFWAVGQMLIVDVDDAALLAAGTLIGVGGLTLVIWWATALRR